MRYEEEMADAAFWNDQEHARDIVQQVKVLKGWVEPVDDLDQPLRDARELDELLALEPDEGMSADLDTEVEGIVSDLDAFELKRTAASAATTSATRSSRSRPAPVAPRRRTGPDAAAHVHALGGAQGLRAGDARSLRRRRSGHQGRGAGDQGAVCVRLPAPESGVHRLVRISPFDSQARRHTSFASVFVYPVVNEEINIEIREEDIKHRCLSAPGRRRTARQQDLERRAHHAHAHGHRLRVAAGALAVQEQGDGDEAAEEPPVPARVDKQAAAKAAFDANKQDVTFGSQIRSYVFQPYTMVNDHRTELKIADVQKVMDGDIDPFIEAYLKQASETAAGGVS
jgi:peptide chain release factor 2